jgi:hypothetical protein
LSRHSINHEQGLVVTERVKPSDINLGLVSGLAGRVDGDARNLALQLFCNQLRALSLQVFHVGNLDRSGHICPPPLAVSSHDDLIPGQRSGLQSDVDRSFLAHFNRLILITHKREA